MTKAVINGRRYNTKTAEMICDISPDGFYGNDYRREDTQLYRTPRGNWFIAGEGGPLSRWARRVGLHGHTDGSGIRALDESEARELLEDHGSAEDYETYFAVEDA
jgi:hypothetical protein